MAKRKHHKKSHTRRRKMSGIKAGSMVSNIAGVAIGAAAAGLITSKVLGKQSDMIKAVAALGLGVLTPTFVKSEIGKAAGAGMIAVGVISLLKKSGLVSGLGEDGVEVTLGEIDNMPVISGMNDVMAGYDNFPVIAGDDTDLL
jgi:hypothetical protein